jgi:hypothetical protein
MRGRSFAVLLLVALPAARVVAQDTTVAGRLPPPQVPGGVYDKPGLTHLGSRTALGGYAEAQVRHERVDGVTSETTFEATRFNLFTSTRVSDFVRIAAELEFEEGGEEIRVEFAAIDVAIHPSLAFRAGMLLSPLGRFNLSHDSPRNEFTDRPRVSTELLGVALSEPGAGLFGLIGVGGSSRLTYELYAVNGFHDGLITDSPEGTRIPLGRRNFRDNNNSPAFVGRVAYSPRRGLEVGLSAHHGAYNVYRLDGEEVDERRNLTIWVADLEVVAAGFRMVGEAAVADIEIPPGLRGVYASSQRGLYLELLRPFGAGWVSTMPQSTFAAKMRIDVVDFDSSLPGDSERQLTLGLNFRPTSESVVKLDYVRGRSRDRFNSPSDVARFLLSVATYF